MKASRVELEGISFHRRDADAYLTVQLGGDISELLECKMTEEELAYIIDEAKEVAEQIKTVKG